MIYDNFISLGHNCAIALAFEKLKIRNEAYPFDWLLMSYEYGLLYVSDLIETNFSNFLTNLSYNKHGKVIPSKYQKMQFYHHDLIKNKIYKRPNDNTNLNLVDAFKRRSERFMNLINSDKKILLIYYFEDIERNYTENKFKIFNDGKNKLLKILDNSRINILLIIKKNQKKYNIFDFIDTSGVTIEYTDTDIKDVLSKYVSLPQ